MAELQFTAVVSLTRALSAFSGYASKSPHRLGAEAV